MIDVWEKSCPAATQLTVPVYVINDLKEPFEQEVTLDLLRDGQSVSTYRLPAKVNPYEVQTVSFALTLPAEPGEYQLKAGITCNNQPVFSLRDLPVIK
ncbi:MAG: hypothetical protein LBL42_07615 [Tannerella sp.]|jgi:hypothetical protein|nr:hypothetical protein [Tannerella sp.]